MSHSVIWLISFDMPSPVASNSSHTRATAATLRLMSGTIRHAIALCLAITACAIAPAQSPSVDPADAAVTHLRKAVQSQRDGSHLPLLFALRQLRDPALRPLFEHLIQHNDWQIRVHAVLALAEIDPAGHIDPALISRVGPTAQEAVIASALDLQLLPVDQIKQTLQLGDLGDLPRLMLYAELALLGHDINLEDLHALIEHDDLRVAGLASLLKSRAGNSAPFQAFQSRFTAASLRMQRAVLPWLLDAVRQYRLTDAEPWLRFLYQDPQLPARDKQFVVLTAFEVDPARNIDLWKDFLSTSPTYSQAVRAGFMLLAAGENAPPHAYDQLLAHFSDDDLLARLTAAGKALALGQDPTDTMINLLDLGHPRTTEWVMTMLRKQDDPAAARVYRHIIQKLLEDTLESEAVAPERIGLAVNAATQLFDQDPQWIIDNLLDDNTSTVLRNALLLGMFESESSHAGQAAASLSTIGVGREASLRTLLIARHAPSLTDENKRQLGIIAAGGGRVSDVMRAQGAWLYLKHTGKTQSAIEQLIAQ